MVETGHSALWPEGPGTIAFRDETVSRGVAVGSAAGLIAVLPHLLGQSADVLWVSLLGLLALVLVMDMVACLVAVVRVSLLPVLKAKR